MSNITNESTNAHRITVIGDPGAGKTTLTYYLSKHLGYPMVSLDNIIEQTRETKSTPRKTRKKLSQKKFRKMVNKITETENWVIDGDYGVVRDIIWKKSDVIIWLDYNMIYLLLRNFRRSLMRLFFTSRVRNDIELNLFENAKNHYNEKRLIISNIIIEYHICSRIFKRHREKKTIISDLNRFCNSHMNLIIIRSNNEKDRWLRHIVNARAGGKPLFFGRLDT